ECSRGNLQFSWRTASWGLQTFWTGRYPDVRGYNFYYDMLELAQAANQPHLEIALWRDGLALGESSPDIAQRAIAHEQMANAAWAANDSRLAAEEFEQSSKLF